MTSPTDVPTGAQRDQITLARVEAPLTLTLDTPRTLGWWDQTVLWFNLGVSLTGPVTALFVLSPYVDGTTMSLFAAFTATVLGAGLGAALLGAAVGAGCEDGGAEHGAAAGAVRTPRFGGADGPEHRTEHRLGHDRDHRDRDGGHRVDLGRAGVRSG